MNNQSTLATETKTQKATTPEPTKKTPQHNQTQRNHPALIADDMSRVRFVLRVLLA